MGKSDRNGGAASASAKRWFDVAAMVFVALVLCLLLAPLHAKGTKWLSTAIADFTPATQVSVILVLSAAVWFVVIRLGGIRLLDLINGSLIRYPPAWWGGVLGAGFILLWPRLEAYGFLNLSNAYRLKEYLHAGLLTFPGGLALAIVCNWFGESQIHRRKRKPKPINVEALSSDVEALRAWIHREDPIDNPADDLLNHAPIAKRLSQMLLEGKARNIGLVGPYGSGKTSVLNMVEFYLHGRDTSKTKSKWRLKDRWHVCRVEAWGRNPDLFAEQLLRCAVQTLGKSVDVLSIVAMPSHYTAAMSGSGSVWANVLSALLMAGTDPVDCLHRMDRILAATRSRLVIFVEDLDRNTSDRLLYDELPALLDQLRRLQHVSFILAIGSERYEAQVLMRICEHLESLT